MKEMILTCNAGSQSLKCALYDAETLTLQTKYLADHIHEKPSYEVKNADAKVLQQTEEKTPGYTTALDYFFAWIQDNKPDAVISAVGHRIVHGGKNYNASVLIDTKVRQVLDALVPLAPLHQPYNLALIDILDKKHPGIPQIACFDTAFHRTQDWLAQQFALPRHLTQDDGILRYGFHGLSYEYIAECLPEYAGEKANDRIVVAHLGGGASMCAMQERKSIATTMGFTALDGLMMGTRCGNLDPGVVLYLLQQKQMTAGQIETLLYKESGLLGASGISHDTRDLIASDKEEAKQAIKLFCHMAARQLGGLMTVLGGLDVLIFTGAMGCEAALIRAQICNYLEWMGVSLDESANSKHQPCISAHESMIGVYVIPTDEEMIIAKHTSYLLGGLQ